MGLLYFTYYSVPVDECSIVISLSVCLSVREHISGTAGPIVTKFWVQIPCGRGSVLLWRRCDTLCASGFLDGVTFGRIGPYCDVAISGRSLMSMNAYEMLLKQSWVHAKCFWLNFGRHVIKLCCEQPLTERIALLNCYVGLFSSMRFCSGIWNWFYNYKAAATKCTFLRTDRKE